jgi:hypothetical protein
VARSYNPSLFIFRIELTYHNILLSLMFCLRQGLVKSKLLQHFQEGATFKTQANLPTQGSLSIDRYSVKYWETMANAMNDCQIYKRQTANKWISNKQLVENLLTKYKVVMNSVETSLNTGFLNSLEKVPSYEDLMRNTVFILTLTFEVSAIHFELFLEFKKNWNILIGNVLHIFREKTSTPNKNLTHLLKFFKKS